MTAYLALDLGASSARVSYGVATPSGIELVEVSRFHNHPVTRDGALYWDGAELRRKSLDGIAAALTQLKERDIHAVSVGIDSWGVDFGIIGNAPEAAPRCYRGAIRETLTTVREQIPARLAYSITGIESLHINTLYQLVDAQKRGDLGPGTRVLLLPDLWVYWLTGKRAAERTIASTTEILSAGSLDWSEEIVERAGIAAVVLPVVVDTGTDSGPLLPEVADSVGDDGTLRVVRVAEHDTASAVVAVPATSDSFAFISSGSWSLAGLQLSAPILSEDAREAGFTNEQGAYGSTLFMRNLSGLWVLEECLREWNDSETTTEFLLADLLAEASCLPGLQSVIDLSDPALIEPHNLPRRIQGACASTDQSVPERPAEITRCLMDSLAVAYRSAIRKAENLSGFRADVIHMIGGGSKNPLLCALTAEACERPVLAGPSEATSLGNILVQAITDGTVHDLKHARALVGMSYPPIRFEAGDVRAEAWCDAEDLLAERLFARGEMMRS